jgi:hypothetical protein
MPARLGPRVNRPSDLWNLQLDSVVRENRKRQPKLVAIERALGLADPNPVEASLGI